MTTLAELERMMAELAHGRPVLYCHPADLAMVSVAVAMLPSWPDLPEIIEWNGTPPGQVILGRLPGPEAGVWW